jgi:hypothetical protein
MVDITEREALGARNVVEFVDEIAISGKGARQHVIEKKAEGESGQNQEIKLFRSRQGHPLSFD